MARHGQLEFHLHRKVSLGGIIGMVLLAAVFFAVAVWPQADETPSGLRELRNSESPACDFIKANPTLYPDGCAKPAKASQTSTVQEWGILAARLTMAWIGLLCIGLIIRIIVFLRHPSAILTISPAGVEGAFLPVSGLAWDDIARISLATPKIYAALPVMGMFRFRQTGVVRLEICPRRSATVQPLRCLLLWPRGLTITSAMVRGPFAEVAAFTEAHAPERLRL